MKTKDIVAEDDFEKFFDTGRCEGFASVWILG